MQVQPINPVYYSYSYRVQKTPPVGKSPQGCQPLKPVDYSIYHSDIKRVSIYEPVPPKIGERAVNAKPEVPLHSTVNSEIGVSDIKDKDKPPTNHLSGVLVYSRNDNNVSFGYSHKLKTLYKKGLLPTVKKGFYGGILSKDIVTLEHLLPHSQRGATTLSNLVLATVENNFKRSNSPLAQFYNPKAAEEYFQQFVGVRVGLLGEKSQFIFDDGHIYWFP